ncbi:lanthionine synthetase C family protein [Streptomyces sp. NPDC050610]|uniref:lanthionine synthetase C family protein n=1 Tax=Streptomyces sp. NPDC050610 TaxID=3157097 RepID=UPI00342333BA
MTAVGEVAADRSGAGMASKLRDIMDDLVGRLTDPEHVAAAATAPDNVDQHAGLPQARPPWRPLGLGEAHPGVALLYAELSHHDSRLRHAAHAHLAAAARGLDGPTGPGLFGGAASLALAALTARHSDDDYADLLTTLDSEMAGQLRSLLAQEAKRLTAGRPGVDMHSYDVVSGATGLGRYLLLRGDEHRPLLIDTLTYLARLTEPVTANGRQVPGWWVPTKPGVGPEYPRGHFNLGLAHGISGPLALLSLAWRQGVRVPGQQAAIIRIVDHLISQQTPHGLWAATIDFDTFVNGHGRHAHQTPRAAWCYGTPGTARAIQLAGLAMERADWQALAVDAMAAALAQPLGDSVTDSSLCHGWAGVLHVTGLMARDSGSRRLAGRLPALASSLRSAYRSDLPFGYVYNRATLGPGIRNAIHRAGFLEGSAGIALALHAYLDGYPASLWSTALLVA